MKENRSNILWVVMDAARFDHFSCYGYRRKTTPFLDKLAKESLLFQNAFSTSHWTPPTHSSMLTGNLPSTHGVFDKSDRMGGVAAGEVFSKDYETLFVASIPHLRKIGADRGFKNRIATTIDLKKSEPLYHKALLKSLSGNDNINTYYKSKKIEAFIENSIKKDKPFFVFVNFNDVHFPYSPPSKHMKFTHPLIDSKKIKKLSGRESPAKKVGKKLIRKATTGSAKQLIDSASKLTKEELDALATLYDCELAYLDNKLGELFNFLKSKEVYDDTIIVITADHGEFFGEHGGVLHQQKLYDTVLHVPLIIKVPGTKHRKIEPLVSLIDIFPTLLHLNDLKISSETDGVSLLPQKKEYHKHLIMEARASKAIRTKDYFFLTAEKDELYDLSNDPEQNINIATKKPGVARQLKATLSKETKKTKKTEAAPKEEISSEDEKKMQKRLLELGYFD